jgi:hypothetical protein
MRLDVVYAQPLNQRIIMRYAMELLEKEEVGEYIEPFEGFVRYH